MMHFNVDTFFIHYDKNFSGLFYDDNSSVLGNFISLKVAVLIFGD